MINPKNHRGGFFAIAAIWVCLISPLAWADGEVANEPAPVPANELGTGTFSPLPFKVSVSVRGGYDDNVTTSSVDKQGSSFTNAAVALTYDFGSPRTQLSLQGGGGYTYYWDNPKGVGFGADQDYDVNGYLGFSLEHKASARLTFTAAGYATYQTEPDFSLALGLNRRSGNYFYTQDKFSATYLWAPRFATTTSYTFGAVNYENGSVGLFEDRFENTFGNEFKFLLAPTTALVAEYRYGLVNYTHDGDVIVPAVFFGPFQLSPAVRLMRDSMSHFVLGGIDHSFNTRFSVSFRGGAEFREYDDVDVEKTSPYFEATANYAVGKNTSVSWTNRYAIEEPDVLLNPNRKTFRTGLQGKHDFTPKLSANFGAYYEHDDYDGVNSPAVISPGFTEESLDLAFSLRYAITRYIGIQAGYNHTEVWSDISVREYSRNRYWGGINVVF